MTDAAQPADTIALLSERIVVLRRDIDAHDGRIRGIEEKLERLGYLPQQLTRLERDISEIKTMVRDIGKVQDQRAETSNQNSRTGFNTAITLGSGFLLFLLGVLANIAIQAVQHR